jgi:hypothetical protein
LPAVIALLGQKPNSLALRSTQPVSAVVAASAETMGVTADDQRRYPERV